MDSIIAQSGYYDVYKPFIEYAKTDTPLFNITIDAATADSTNGTVSLTMITADTLPENAMTGCLAICQDSVAGIMKMEGFNYVCYQFYSFPLNLVYPDTLDTTITFTHSLLTGKLKAVAFVQDDVTKQILQAAIKKFEEVP